MDGMKKYEIILWDVDQTLLDFSKSEDYAIRRTFLQFGRTIGDETVAIYSQINDSYWKRLEKGEITKERVLKGRFESLFETMGILDIPVEEFAALYQKELGSVYFYRDDSLKLCRELKAEGFRQFVVTNGVAATQENKLKLSGLAEMMEDIFISETLGSPKPSGAFFDACFERISGFRKEKTIIIGDSLSSDMTGGSRAGICCCWYHPEGTKDGRSSFSGEKLQIQYEIKNLWEIKDILYG